METNKFIEELKKLIAEAKVKSVDGKLSLIEIAGFIDNFVKIYNAINTDGDITIIISDVKEIFANLKKKD